MRPSAPPAGGFDRVSGDSAPDLGCSSFLLTGTGIPSCADRRPHGAVPRTKETGVTRTRTIALALAVVIAALALPGSALPQALTIGTDGQAGDGSHSVAPISLAQENGDSNVAANAGSGDGNAATAGAQNSDGGGTAAVGCADGTAGTGGSGLSASAGNCGSGGGGRAAGAGTDNGDANAIAGLGCIARGLIGSTNGDAQVGSCRDADTPGGGDTGGGDGNSGDDGSPGSGGGSGDEPGAASGSSAGPDAQGGSDGPGGQNPGDKGPCGSFTQLAGFGGPGTMPLWMLALGVVAAFAGGALFARRRSGELID